MFTAAGRHPHARTYWLVALFLAVVTAVEISIPYIDALSSVGALLLILLGAVKFFTVVGIFMHLRYDLASYRLYFLFGLIGALLVFVVVLATFSAL